MKHKIDRYHKYDDRIVELEEELQALTAIASSILETLAEHGQQDFVLIKNKEARNWWKEHRKRRLEEAESAVRLAEVVMNKSKLSLKDDEAVFEECKRELKKLKESLKL